MNPNELDDLLDAHFLGGESGQEHARLEELLRSDAANRRRFVQASLLEAQLYATLGAASGSPVIENAKPSLRGEPSSMRAAAKAVGRIGPLIGAGLRRFDLAAVVVVAVVAISGYYAVRVGFPPPANLEQVPALRESKPVEELKPDAEPQKADGRIEAVDAEAKTFVLVGGNERRTTFRVPPTLSGGREPVQVLLDGNRSTFDEAVRPGRTASVTFVAPDGEEPWVWKVEVSTGSR